MFANLAAAPPVAAVDPAKVEMLSAMGFTEEQSRTALEASNGDAEAAANMLLSAG